MVRGRLGGCFVALVVLSALVLGACSSDPSSSSATAATAAPTTGAPTTTTTPAVIKADYVQQANALCAEMNQKVKALPLYSTDAAVVAGEMEKGIAIVRDTLARLRALPMPAGDEATLEAYHAAIEANAAKADEVVAALRSGDGSRMAAADDALQADTKKVNAMATAYGETECAK
jgi:hypothetical protein